MKTNLSEYLREASNYKIPPFPLSEDRLRSIAKGKELIQNATKLKFFNKNKGVLIMSAFLMCIISIILSLLFSDNMNESRINKKTDEMKIMNSTVTNPAGNLSLLSPEESGDISLPAKNFTGAETGKIENNAGNCDLSRNFTRKIESGTESEGRISEQKINGIEKLILTEEEYKKLGITFSDWQFGVKFESRINTKEIPVQVRDEVLKIFADSNYSTSEDEILARSIAVIDINKRKVNNELEKYSGWNYNEFSRTAPVAISATIRFSEKDNGKMNDFQVSMLNISDYSPLIESPDDHSSNFIDYDSGTYKPKIDMLIPVSFEFENISIDDSRIIKQADVNVWFYVTRDFAVMLPERYKNPILEELDLISRVEDGDLNLQDACGTLKGKVSYFDLCRTGGKIISDFLIEPNPVDKGNFTVKFALSKPVALQIELFDINGSFIKTFNDFKEYGAGNNSHYCSAQGLGEGVYLIAVITKSGEKIVRKLIIK